MPSFQRHSVLRLCVVVMVGALLAVPGTIGPFLKRCGPLSGSPAVFLTAGAFPKGTPLRLLSGVNQLVLYSSKTIREEVHVKSLPGNPHWRNAVLVPLCSLWPNPPGQSPAQAS